MCIKGRCPFTLFGQQRGDHAMQGSCAQLKEAVSCRDRRPSARPPRGRRAKGEGGQRPELLTSQDLDAATAIRVRAGPCETLAMLLGALRDSAAGAAGCYGPRLGETCGRREGRSSPPRGDCAGLWAPCAAGRGGGRFRPGDGPALVAGPGGAARI